MSEETVKVAEAKKHFSELLGEVAYGKKQILITIKSEGVRSQQSTRARNDLSNVET